MSYVTMEDNRTINGSFSLYSTSSLLQKASKSSLQMLPTDTISNSRNLLQQSLKLRTHTHTHPPIPIYCGIFCAMNKVLLPSWNWYEENIVTSDYIQRHIVRNRQRKRNGNLGTMNAGESRRKLNHYIYMHDFPTKISIWKIEFSPFHGSKS